MSPVMIALIAFEPNEKPEQEGNIMSLAPLERITIEPQQAARACVIWLHGLGDSGAGFAPVVPALGLPKDHGIRFIFPHAPEQAVTINGGYVMRAWYDIKSMELHQRADFQGVLSAESSVRSLIEEQIESGIPASKIILAGFSQGGVMSLFTGLRYPQSLAGIMALSCYLPTGNKLPDELATANRGTAILQHHGEQDDVVPVSAGLKAKEVLQLEGYDVQWKTYPMPHSVLPQQLEDISVWIQKMLF